MLDRNLFYLTGNNLFNLNIIVKLWFDGRLNRLIFWLFSFFLYLFRGSDCSFFFLNGSFNNYRLFSANFVNDDVCLTHTIICCPV